LLPQLLWVVEPKARWAFFEQPVETEGFLAHGWERGAGEGEVAVLADKMEKGQASTVTVAFLVAVSIVGLALIIVLVLQPNLEHFQPSVRHGLVGSLYGVICLLGIAAVFYPAKCKDLFQKQSPLSQASESSGSVRISGHHPDCKNFSVNRIRINRREVCAACSGLLVGAMIALVGSALQFFIGLNIVSASVWLLVLGEICMFLGLAQIKFAGYAKVIVNVVFVAGSFVTLAGADVLGESLLIDIYVLGLIGFLLWLRILLSEQNNRQICQTCRLCFQ
jgi:uncharacterized membrane protein